MAKIFHVSSDASGESMKGETVRAHRFDHHTHHRENNERDNMNMYDEVGAKLRDSTRILVLGPGHAKDHFITRLKQMHPEIAKKVVGCESSDHPTDPQIAAYAVKYFH